MIYHYSFEDQSQYQRAGSFKHSVIDKPVLDLSVVFNEEARFAKWTSVFPSPPSEGLDLAMKKSWITWIVWASDHPGLFLVGGISRGPWWERVNDPLLEQMF